MQESEDHIFIPLRHIKVNVNWYDWLCAKGVHHCEFFAGCKQKGIKALRYCLSNSHISPSSCKVFYLMLNLCEMRNQDIFFLSILLPDDSNQPKTTVSATSQLSSVPDTHLSVRHVPKLQITWGLRHWDQCKQSSAFPSQYPYQGFWCGCSDEDQR